MLSSEGEGSHETGRLKMTKQTTFSGVENISSISYLLVFPIPDAAVHVTPHPILIFPHLHPPLDHSSAPCCFCGSRDYATISLSLLK